MPPLPMTPRRPSSRITSAWYGSSRIEVVGPAATHFQFPASSLITNGPQWYRIPSFNLTSGGSRPPSCKYLWTASRPVNSVPLIPTSSPTLSARMADSETGVARLIISKWSDDHSSHTSHSSHQSHEDGVSVEPFLDIPVCIEAHALPSVSPAHVTDAHKKRCRKPVRCADFRSQQRRFSSKTHRADSKLVGRLNNVLLQALQFGVF